MRCYLDSSALAKLVLRERETTSLREYLKKSTMRLTSAISEVELRRAAARANSNADVAARRVLSVVTQVEVTRDVLKGAATVMPTTLKSLDALHLATALLVASDLDVFVTYDPQLGAAAATAGFVVVQPGG
ncbi:MAG: type II toxin-antitoxin system VapC family toxin [Actinomycetota bacterium]|nr:type II toxin-antitoxin system VapC family toxin [Actinomycetota bacterium]